jgi:hypothetical protein
METRQTPHEYREPQLDTAGSLALALNVSQAWVRKHTALGLPHIKCGKATRYSRAEVLAYLKAKRDPR